MDGPAPPRLPARFADWFAGRGWAAREHQLAMIDKGRQGRDALLIAPTGGKEPGGGLSPTKWSAAGFGDTDPVKSNDTPDGKQANRRVELVKLK